jgi:DNA polymerase I-like protein with 3'-5' exonuclease and polymerase domains
MSGAGSFREHAMGMTLWTLHPAAILRSPEYEPMMARDLAAAAAYVKGGGLPELPPLNWYVVTPDKYGIDADKQMALMVAEKFLPADDELVVVDTETTGLDPRTDKLLGVGFYFPQRKVAVYVPWRHGESAELLWAEPERSVLPLLRKWLTGPQQRILQNVHFDVNFIREDLGIDILPVAHDTLVEAGLVDENTPKGLKERASRLLGAPDYDRDLKESRDGAGKHLGMCALEDVARYCCYDCYYTWGLHQYYQAHMTEKQKALQQVLLDPQMNQLLRMAQRGVAVDVAAVEELGVRLDEEAVKTLAEVNQLAGTSETAFGSNKKAPPGLNLRSTPQRRHLLFSLLGLEPMLPKQYRYWVEAGPRGDAGWTRWSDSVEEARACIPAGMDAGKTEDGSDLMESRVHPEHLTGGGELSTSAKTINYLAALPLDEKTAGILKAMQAYAKVAHCRSNFVDGTLEWTWADGKVHAEFTQSVVVTGRLSCKRPGLQQVSKPLRPLFVAPEGYVWIEVDYSSIETLVWAELSQDPRLLHVLATEPDYHRYTVGAVLGKPADQVTDDERSRGKVLTFGGLMYGGGPGVIARSMKVSMAEAQQHYKAMSGVYAQGVAWMDAQKDRCRVQGYVESPFGRIRRLPGINSTDNHVRIECERQSVNALIQSAASDITGLSALRVEKLLEREGLDAWIAVLVHDAIVVICREDQAERARDMMVEEMCKPPYRGWTTPLEAKAEITKRWGADEFSVEAAIKKIVGQETEEDDEEDEE